ncbi:hypothetical protein C8J55DRAFT_132003 [Lentinula edodes]|uniref:Uncharacterized protein n=1 Tax=Lentinula lateritia TaxID=40482 RepID=A0A9W9A6R1_9AGAR|nr:hypothetical protein C8J55DRAFT_132003 [Lentinula edodes]
MVHSRTVYTALFAIAGSASSVLAVPISSSSSSSAPTSSTLAAIATATTSGIGIAPAFTSGLVVPFGSVPNSRRSEAVDVFVDDVNDKFKDEEEDEENKLDLALIPVPVPILFPAHEKHHVMDAMIPKHLDPSGSDIKSDEEEVTLGINIGARTPIEEDEEPLIPKTPSALDSSLASDPTQPTSLRKKLGNGLKTSVSNVLSGFTAGHGTPGAPSVKPGNPSSATN